ncbi:hypothetical protein Q5P01_016540 [Channa striata]|uniref:Uncharacterized protein n=1 Tax=Channa striata TaxID=64152 RepID=A0AA88MI08_CHASR|nr:hypothetical protein Q5P01_016540 [Channa striata]
MTSDRSTGRPTAPIAPANGVPWSHGAEVDRNSLSATHGRRAGTLGVMSGMTTRKRSLLRSRKKRGRENGDGDGGDEENSSCDLGCPHAGMVGRMKREITELKGVLEEERRLRSEALRARTKSRSSFPPRDPSDASACPPSGDASAALGRATYELEVCRRDLEDAKRALHEALDK